MNVISIHLKYDAHHNGGAGFPSIIFASESFRLDASIDT